MLKQRKTTEDADVGKQKPIIILSLDQQSMSIIMPRARDLGYQCFDLNISYDAIPESLKPAGAIIRQLPDSEFGKAILAAGCPAIRLGRAPHPMDDKLPSIGFDMHAVGRMGADHFGSRGFEHVAFIGFAPWGDGKGIFDGFSERAEELGMRCHLLQRKPTPRELQADRPSVYRFQSDQIKEWLATTPRPLGVMSGVGVDAGRLCWICNEMGISVPEEVAIIATGTSLAASEFYDVPLTVIEWQNRQHALTALDHLVKLINDEAIPNHTAMPPSSLIERMSTDVIATPDQLVSHAIRYLWDHLSWPLTVDDVAVEMDISRSTLERRFRKALGRGVNAELLRKRLEHSAKLLKNTEMTVEEITAAIGFQSRRYFHHAFQKAYNVTPAVYREGGPKPQPFAT